MAEDATRLSNQIRRAVRVWITFAEIREIRYTLSPALQNQRTLRFQHMEIALTCPRETIQILRLMSGKVEEKKGVYQELDVTICATRDVLHFLLDRDQERALQ
jgi:hypothetical protein